MHNTSVPIGVEEKLTQRIEVVVDKYCERTGGFSSGHSRLEKANEKSVTPHVVSYPNHCVASNDTVWSLTTNTKGTGPRGSTTFDEFAFFPDRSK